MGILLMWKRIRLICLLYYLFLLPNGRKTLTIFPCFSKFIRNHLMVCSINWNYFTIRATTNVFGMDMVLFNFTSFVRVFHLSFWQ